MSYEKIKCITRKPKEGKIFITSACNNVRPLKYSRWEFRADEQDYHEKELRLLRGINGGGLVLMIVVMIGIMLCIRQMQR